MALSELPFWLPGSRSRSAPSSSLPSKVRALIKRLSVEWPGNSYELLQRNCCTFCEHLASQLKCDPTPGARFRGPNPGDTQRAAVQPTVPRSRAPLHPGSEFLLFMPCLSVVQRG